MATKKKVLLEQETPVPENTAPADGTISSAGPPADAAAPPDSDDLSALLASMDQTNDSASTDQPDGDATLEGSDPPLEFMETEASDAAITEIGKRMRSISPELCKQMTFQVLFYRYYNFDLDQPFLEQYAQNTRLLLEKLRQFEVER